MVFYITISLCLAPPRNRLLVGPESSAPSVSDKARCITLLFSFVILACQRGEWRPILVELGIILA